MNNSDNIVIFDEFEKSRVLKSNVLSLGDGGYVRSCALSIFYIIKS